MTTISYFLLSAALYAAIPFMILSFGSLHPMNAMLVLGMTIVASTLACIPHLRRLSMVLLSGPLAVYAIVNAIGFVGFIALLEHARGKVEPIFALVVVESWPLLAAISYPLLKIGQGKRVSLFALSVATLAVGGIFLISLPEFTSQKSGDLLGDGAPWDMLIPVLAMIAMTIGSLAKAKYVDLAKRDYGIGPVLSFFTMYAQILPLAVPALFLLLSRSDGQPTPTEMEAALIITVANTISAILFSFGTLKMRQNSDLFIWFFAPVFSVLFFCVYNTTLPLNVQAAGIGLIVGSNLVLSLNTEDRLGYRAAVLSMMVIGSLAVFPSLAPFDAYYDSLAVLSIFVSITLAFMLERVSARAEHEIELVQDVLQSCEASPHSETLVPIALKLQTARAAIRVAWLHRKLVQAGAEPDVLSAAMHLGISRQRGLRFSNLFALVAAIAAIVVVVMIGRPEGWQHDFIAVLFVPSLIYALFYLHDLNESRFTAYRYRKLTRGKRWLALDFLRPGRRLDRRNAVWSSVLIVFLVLNFTGGFLAKQHKSDQSDAQAAGNPSQ